ncbi:Reverse transcriptase domain-containing protein [Aphis craccivora]|uniref:Reverse transcriptase domain-containing protein n=1 Tax=Aphis craccivora TaxID=307492 RepID=A0A6G0YBY8_APHCR|nr:Reverse transcriptase domain-containing protein [Aphis craccivora]
MDDRRAGSKRNRTPPGSNTKKTGIDSYSPPPSHADQRQRAEPPSPNVDEDISGESYFSDSTSTASISTNQSPSPSPTPNQPNQNNLDDTTNMDYASVTKPKKTLNSEQFCLHRTIPNTC